MIALNDLKIGTRLTLGFGVLIAFLILISVVAITRVISINATTESIVNERYAKIAQINEIERRILKAAEQQPERAASEPGVRMFLAGLILGAVPAATVALYLAVGTPNAPDLAMSVASDEAMTADQLAEVNGAKDTYKKMRAASANDDITPELYLYSVLQDYLLYDDMKPVVDEMAKRQPGNTEVNELVSWVKSKTN